MPHSSKDSKTYGAPVLPFEYPWRPDDVIWPCSDCLPWHLELFHDPETDEVWVREWHAVGCRIWEDTEQDRPTERPGRN